MRTFNAMQIVKTPPPSLIETPMGMVRLEAVVQRFVVAYENLDPHNPVLIIGNTTLIAAQLRMLCQDYDPESPNQLQEVSTERYPTTLKFRLSPTDEEPERIYLNRRTTYYFNIFAKRFMFDHCRHFVAFRMENRQAKACQAYQDFINRYNLEDVYDWEALKKAEWRERRRLLDPFRQATNKTRVAA